MKRITLLLISSGIVFSIISLNLYYSLIKFDTVKVKNLISKSNMIFEEVIKVDEISENDKYEYIKQLTIIEKKMEHSKSVIVSEKYKQSKMDMIKNLKKYIQEDDDKQIYLHKINDSNKISKDELSKAIK